MYRGTGNPGGSLPIVARLQGKTNNRRVELVGIYYFGVAPSPSQGRAPRMEMPVTDYESCLPSSADNRNRLAELNRRNRL